MFHASMKEKMSALEAKKADLEAQLSATPDPDPIVLHPRFADVYAEKIRQLIAALNDPALRQIYVQKPQRSSGASSTKWFCVLMQAIRTTTQLRFMGRWPEYYHCVQGI